MALLFTIIIAFLFIQLFIVAYFVIKYIINPEPLLEERNTEELLWLETHNEKGEKDD